MTTIPTVSRTISALDLAAFPLKIADKGKRQQSSFVGNSGAVSLIDIALSRHTSRDDLQIVSVSVKRSARSEESSIRGDESFFLDEGSVDFAPSVNDSGPSDISSIHGNSRFVLTSDSIEYDSSDDEAVADVSSIHGNEEFYLDMPDFDEQDDDTDTSSISTDGFANESDNNSVLNGLDGTIIDLVDELGNAFYEYGNNSTGTDSDSQFSVESF